MKVEFTDSGCLRIIPESQAEERATRTWIRDNLSFNEETGVTLNLGLGSISIPSDDGFDWIDYELEML